MNGGSIFFLTLVLFTVILLWPMGLGEILVKEIDCKAACWQLGFPGGQPTVDDDCGCYGEYVYRISLEDAKEISQR